MKLPTQIIEEKYLISCFSKHPIYNVNIDFESFVTHLLKYQIVRLPEQYSTIRILDLDEHVHKFDPYVLLKGVIPEFQRANDKWSRAKQIKFIENLINGCETTIEFFTINKLESTSDAWIIDGLQRSTAIIEFVIGTFNIFDNNVSYQDINKPEMVRRSFRHVSLKIKMFQFKTVEEAIQYYIDVNEGCTHSEADINKAKFYLTD